MYRQTNYYVSTYHNKYLKIITSWLYYCYHFKNKCRNDINHLENLAFFPSIKKVESKGVDLIVGLFTGELMRSSLLSSLDKRKSIINIINQSGIDYMCLSDNTPYATWINEFKAEPIFNVLNSYSDKHGILEIKDSSGHIRRVLISNFPTMYSESSMPILDQTNKSIAQLQQGFATTSKIDCIIPITNQPITLNHKLADMNLKIPLIIGKCGDVEYSLATQTENCVIFNPSNHSNQVKIVDITWPHLTSNQPIVSVVIKETTDYTIDSDMKSLKENYQSILDNIVSISNIKLFHFYFNGKIFCLFLYHTVYTLYISTLLLLLLG